MVATTSIVMQRALVRRLHRSSPSQTHWLNKRGGSTKPRSSAAPARAGGTEEDAQGTTHRTTCMPYAHRFSIFPFSSGTASSPSDLPLELRAISEEHVTPEVSSSGQTRSPRTKDRRTAVGRGCVGLGAGSGAALPRALRLQAGVQFTVRAFGAVLTGRSWGARRGAASGRRHAVDDVRRRAACGHAHD